MKFGYEHEIDSLRSRVAELEAAVSSAARTAEKVDRQLANVEGERNHLFSKNEDLVARVAELEAELARSICAPPIVVNPGWSPSTQEEPITVSQLTAEARANILAADLNHACVRIAELEHERDQWRSAHNGQKAQVEEMKALQDDVRHRTRNMHDLAQQLAHSKEALTSLEQYLDKRVAELEAERDAALKAVDENWVTHQQVIASRAREQRLKDALSSIEDHGGSADVLRRIARSVLEQQP